MKLVTREQWGARPPENRTRIYNVKGLTVHWEGPRMGPFSHIRCASKVKAIQSFHMGPERKWADVAYSYLVCPHGYVYEGRGALYRTAANGTNAGNDRYLAVCYLGGTGDPFTTEAKNAILELREFLDLKLLNAHRDHRATECPGDKIYAWVRSCPDRQPPPPVPDPNPVPTPPEEETMKLYITSDSVNGGEYATNGIVKWPLGSQMAKNEYARVFGATRITLTPELFDAIPTHKEA